MRSETLLNRLVSQISSSDYEQKKAVLIVNVLMLSSAVIYIFETLLMVFLEIILKIPEPYALVLDGAILILMLFPINYYFIIRPMVQQIDAHHRTSQELSQANEVLERFFSISEILIAYMDENFNFLRVNQAYAAGGSLNPEDYIGKNHFHLFPSDENKAIFENVIKTGSAYYAVEQRFPFAAFPERGACYWDWSLLPVKDQENQVVSLILVLNNVTDRKQAQHALASSERRFRGVFNQTFQHSVLLDPEGSVLHVNQTALDFYGASQEVFQGLHLWELPWWDPAGGVTGIHEPVKTSVQQAESGSFVRFEHRIRSKRGEKAVMDITIKPIYDEAGTAVMLIYEARDISERYRAEEALKFSGAVNRRLYMSEKNAREFAEALRGAVLALSGSLNSQTVLGTLLDYLKKLLPYTSAHLLLLEDEEHLEVRLARGEDLWPKDLQLIGRRFNINDLEFFQPLLQKREILTVPDTLLYVGALFLPDDEFVRSWLGIPLLAGEQIVGVCVLEHICPGFFTEERIQWATALTGQAAVAIQNAWLFEQVRDGREHLQALSRRLVEVQENERHYIARELHDEAGQALASLMIGLSRLERDSSNQESVIKHSRELKQIADEVLENLHRLAINLRPAALDHLGLVAVLRQYIETIAVKHGLVIQFETVGEIERLPGEVETAVYRIVQESITNVIRHSHATHVGILLERRDKKLIAIVEDDGIGFDPYTPKVNQLGVLGMVERAEMLEGTITIESAPGKGTTVQLEVPWQPES